jgi:hypothetical protein
MSHFVYSTAWHVIDISILPLPPFSILAHSLPTINIFGYILVLALNTCPSVSVPFRI